MLSDKHMLTRMNIQTMVVFLYAVSPRGHRVQRSCVYMSS